ncbi:MAG: twin-arginine translocase TatA/TatE family subunit [Leptospirales bacterium]
MFSGLFEPVHLLVILGIVLLLFGGRKLPEIGSGMGKAIANFRRSFKGEDEEGHHDNPADSSSKSESESKTPLSR